MLSYIQGDIFESDCDSLICPVNCVGIMGKGLALKFAKHYPLAKLAYEAHCEKKLLKPGGVTSTRQRRDGGERVYIVFLATKQHWRDPSRLEWVEEGLANLVSVFVDGFEDETSLAIPALGCGLGGLRWEDVKPLFDKQFRDTTMRVDVFTP